MSDQNAAVVRCFVDEFLNDKNDAVVDADIADDFVCHVVGNLAGNTFGRDAWRRRATRIRSAFPDLRITIDDLIAAGVKVVIRYHGDATHRRAIFGVEATNLPMTYTSVMILRMDGGQIAEEWTEAKYLLSYTVRPRCPTRKRGVQRYRQGEQMPGYKFRQSADQRHHRRT